MPLSRTLYRDIHTALLDRFSMSDLERLVRFHIEGERLDRIASPRANLTDTVTALLDYADQHGWVTALLEAAIEERPRIANLKTLLTRYKTEIQTSSEGSPMPDSSSAPAWQQQRLNDLQRNIEKNQKLLNAYQNKLDLEDDPRRMMRYEEEIERQRKAVAQYQQELDELTTDAAQPPETATIAQTLADMQTQITGMEQRLSAKMDANQTELESLLNRLSADQRAASDQLVALVDQGKLAQEQRDEITMLVQRALVDLRHMPNPSYWVRLEQAVSDQTSVDGKLKLMIPLLPILAYEVELTTPLLPELRNLWERLKTRIGRNRP